MSAPFDLSKPNRPIHVGVILMDSVTEILDVAPIHFFSGMSVKSWEAYDIPEEVMPRSARTPDLDFEFHWVSEKGPGHTIKLTSGIRLDPTDSFDTCPPLDIVLIGACEFKYTPSAAEIAYIRKAYDASTAFLTICGGIVTLCQAGLVAGKSVTGPRGFLPMLRMQTPEANWVEKRWVRDGKLWSSGALLNGTDMMVEFGRETWGAGKGDEEEDKDVNLVEFVKRLGGWPHREVDYKDVPWVL
ncbi:DJ-1/PfpI family protein [Sarocladium implicatum]|nr:DJ-1/PfpI family protein [Sarocladium implicatum]